jgi:hypothetical protein
MPDQPKTASSQAAPHSVVLTGQKKSQQIVKRKPGFSIVNPHVKRHTIKGAKIGEDCTPPSEKTVSRLTD